MKIKDLFDKGSSFEEFVNIDTASYKEKTLEILETINFDEKCILQIKAIKKNINILVCGEIWCPDCMINIPVIEKMKQYNKKINISIVGKEGNEEIFKEYCNVDHVKVPTFIICNENFNKLGCFIEHPKSVKDIIGKGNQPNVIVTMRKYSKGEYAQETLKEILDIIIKK